MRSNNNKLMMQAHFVHTKRGYTEEETLTKADGFAVIAVWFQVASDPEEYKEM